MESNFGNVASITLLKSFSVVDTVLQILQELINNFFKEHLTPAFHQTKIKDFDLTSLSAHLFSTIVSIQEVLPHPQPPYYLNF